MPDTLIFYALSGLAILASALVIGQRNPMYSVLLLIVSFAALAGLYITLDAPFVAMAQMIIYAAARRAAVASVPPSVRDLVTVCAESHRVRSRLAR